MATSVWADVYRSIDESGTHCIEESLRRPGEIPVGLYRRYGPYSEADAHRLFERLIELPSVIARKPDVTIIERPTSSLRSERVIVRVWQHPEIVEWAREHRPDMILSVGLQLPRAGTARA